MAQKITTKTNIEKEMILKAIAIREENENSFIVGHFYKIENINKDIVYNPGIKLNGSWYAQWELIDYFEIVDSLDDVEDLENKALIFKETFEQIKEMSKDDEFEMLSIDPLIQETINFLISDEKFQGNEIELRFICDNMDITMVEQCSCCGKILLPDDEVYEDEINNGESLCEHCSIFNEDTNMYQKALHKDVIEKITGLKFSPHIGNIDSKIEEFNQFIKENKFKFSILEKDEINSTTFLSFMSERTDWNTCEVCGLIEVSTDLVWDTDEVFFSNEYEKLRFLKAALVPSEAVCQSCLNLVEEIKKPGLETITSRKQENNLIFRVGEFVLLSNVEWADKPRVSNYIAKIVSLDENKKTYTLEGYGDAEFKEDEFYDVVSEAYVREFRNFIDDSYPDKSDKIYQETEPNGEGISKIDYVFKEFGYKKEFIEHLKSNNLPYGRFLEPKFKIGDKFKVHFDYYEKGETTEHTIAKIDTSFTEADEIVYWSDDQVYITESELIKQTSNYVVWVVYANNLEFYKNGMTKNEAETLYIELCKRWYHEDGLENFKEFLEVEELSISQYHEYYQSEQYLDSGDLSHVSLEKENK